MNGKKITGCLAAIVLVVLGLLLFTSVYTVKETEQVIVTQFGDPVGDPVTEAGLKFKVPFIHTINRFEKRILEWDGRASEMPTKEKTYIIVDTYGRWRIDNALLYLEKLQDEDRALSRLDDILGSETRNTIAKHRLIEVIRSTKEREPETSDALSDVELRTGIGKLLPIQKGRTVLENEIFERSRSKLAEFGIELLDVRFKRVNYNPNVSKDIYERMISERQQIAERYRSEGQGEAAKILGDMERDLSQIESEAYKRVEIVKGEADAKATEIYAKAYNQNPDAAEFYEFVKTMELYPEMLGNESTLMMSTDSDLFRFLKRADGSESTDATPAPKPARVP